jgi:putative transposase
MHPTEDDWAVFWCQLLGPILLDEVEPGERRRFLRELSQQQVKLPNGNTKCLSLSTLRRKVRQFRNRRLAGLQRKSRRDRGQARKDRQKMLVRAVELKRQQPRRSPQAINVILEHEFGRTIPKATLNRHLHAAGVTRRKLGIVEEKIRCRWTRDHSNALWVGDFADGPYVFQEGQAIRTHLSVWIDCHSRCVVEGRYYFRENLDILIDSLLRAWGNHGASRELYVDNAKIYHSRALRLACTDLNIQLLHRPPKDPPAGGLVERVIQTIQDQFESEIRSGKTLTLEELNRYFQAWLHVQYHETVHSHTQEQPRARFQAGTRYIRHVNMADALRLFHLRERRRVDPIHCDVTLNKRYFAVRPEYRGDRVLVSYDPFTRSEEVELYSLAGVYLQRAPRYERVKGTHPFAEPPADVRETTPLDHNYLDLLATRHQEQLAAAAAQGMSYHKARQFMTLVQLAAALAKFLGRQGGASSWSTEDLEFLARVQRRYPRITSSLLEQACQRADPKTLPVIVFQLQQLMGS